MLWHWFGAMVWRMNIARIDIARMWPGAWTGLTLACSQRGKVGALQLHLSCMHTYIPAAQSPSEQRRKKTSWQQSTGEEMVWRNVRRTVWCCGKSGCAFVRQTECCPFCICCFDNQLHIHAARYFSVWYRHRAYDLRAGAVFFVGHRLKSS